MISPRRSRSSRALFASDAAFHIISVNALVASCHQGLSFGIGLLSTSAAWQTINHAAYAASSYLSHGHGWKFSAAHSAAVRAIV